ncbi:TPA: DNA-3-methyladenine glycosylase I, partial [Yersinia enterocolitica]
MSLQRCGWVTSDPLYLAYHDTEWGIPRTDSQALFEMLCLEGQQAGLSWITVLKKREHYRKCFYNFDPVRVAKMGPDD